jgi:SAM-dependent methyltransferase
MAEISPNNSTSNSSPPIAMLQMISGVWLAQLIYAAARLGIADLLKDGPKSIENIAQSTNTQVPYLYRALRALASYGIFSEVEKGTFALTPLAETLQEGTPDSMRNLAITCGEDYYFTPFGQIIHTLQTGKSAFHKTHGIGLFEYLTKNPEMEIFFNKAMPDYTSQINIGFVATYDFSQATKVLDIGGGYGQLIIPVLKKYPHLKGILFDRPTVIDGSKKSIADAGLADRCECVGGNFFEGVPSGGDVYMLSSIIHGWDDKDSAAILGNCRRAMVDNGKLLLADLVVAPGNEPSFAKIHDINLMIAADSGKERTEEEFRKLFELAGLKLTRIIPTNTFGSIIEGTPMA